MNQHNHDTGLPDINEGQKQTQQRPKTKSNKKKQLPLPMKIASALFLIVIGFVIVKLILPADEVGQVENRVPFTSEVNVDDVGPDPDVSPTQVQTIPVESSDLAETLDIDGELDFEEVPNAAFLERIIALEAKLERYHTQMAAQMDEIEQRVSTTTDVETVIEQKFMMLHEAMAKFKDWSRTMFVTKSVLAPVIDELADTREELKSLHDTVVKKSSQPVALPFRLISIDMWNNKPYAAIELKAHISLLTESDQVLTWRLVTLSFAEQKAVFESQEGNLVEVSVN